jgi:hypothetical protein
MKTKLILLLLMLTFVQISFAQSNFKLKKITVFKDGTTYIEKELSSSTKNKAIHFDNLPINLKTSADPTVATYSNNEERITLGTLRFSAINNEIIESYVNRKYTDTSYREYYSIAEFLILNKGKKVKINSPATIKQSIYQIVNVVDNTLVAKIDDNFCFFSLPSISNIEFVDKPESKVKMAEYEKKPDLSLDIKLANDSKNQQINLSYLQKGITWLPTYFIDINDQKKGKLTLEANLMNDIEDLDNVEINFAVGVPAFAFKSVQEPLVSNRSVWEFLSQLNNQQLQEYSNNIQMNMMSQNNLYREPGNDIDYKPETEGTGGEDLYFYKKQNMSLNKNGRLKTQLLAFDIDYDDLYSCDLEQNTTNDNNSKSKTNKVWHSISFKNTSNQPLTTGTVFFKKEDKNQMALISQNQLDYTPKNEYVIAKMAIAPDILVSSKDVETERKDVGSDYLLNIDGEICIVNYKKFDIEIVIDRKVIGTMLNSDLTWKVTSNLDSYNAKNTSNSVSWKLKVAAGKTVQIKYKYKILVD